MPNGYKTFIDHITKTAHYEPPGFEPSPTGLRAVCTATTVRSRRDLLCLMPAWYVQCMAIVHAERGIWAVRCIPIPPEIRTTALEPHETCCIPLNYGRRYLGNTSANTHTLSSLSPSPSSIVLSHSGLSDGLSCDPQLSTSSMQSLGPHR